MKFLLHFSPQQFAPATDRFPMFVSEHATAKSGSTIKRFSVPMEEVGRSAKCF